MLRSPAPFAPAVLVTALLAACSNEKVPEDALWYDVTVTGVGPDECHPGNTEGYQENFRYALAFSASSATIYIDDVVFASGTLTGCNLTYTTVVYGEDTENGHIQWQLEGQAQVDAGDDSCVEGEGDWAGTEVFKVVEADSDDLEPGCTYPMETTGTYLANPE